MFFWSFLIFTHRWLCWVGLAQQGFCSHLRPSVLLSAMAATKRQHRALTLEKKIEVINDFDSGCFTKTALATKYAIPKSSLTRILHDKEKLRSAFSSTQFGPKRMRLRLPEHEELEKCLALWLRRARSENRPVIGPIMWIYKSSNLVFLFIILPSTFTCWCLQIVHLWKQHLSWHSTFLVYLHYILSVNETPDKWNRFSWSLQVPFIEILLYLVFRYNRLWL